jgi:hypothetical protein
MFIGRAGRGVCHLGAGGIYKGHITAGRNHPHTFFAAREPVGFWLTVSVIIVLGAICVYRGIKGKSED